MPPGTSRPCKMVVSKEYIAVKLLHDRVTEEIPEFNIAPTTLTNWIRNIGSKFKKNSNRLFLMERPSVKLKRTKFLREYHQHKGKHLYEPLFLDETWVFSKGNICKKTWQDGSENTAIAKTGEGCR